MHAGMLTCPGCGAGCAAHDVRCAYCGVQLQTTRCPSCLAMSFVGAQHCAGCGARLTSPEAAPAGAHACPRCKAPLGVMAIGESILEECPRCGGVWVDAVSFEKLARDRAAEAAYTGSGSPLPAPAHPVAPEPVRYAACPACAKLMQRVNFARVSGVIVDVCKGHGTWFDKDELAQVIGFIQAGGLDAARAREQRDLEAEKARLRERERALSAEASSGRDERTLRELFDLLR